MLGRRTTRGEELPQAVAAPRAEEPQMDESKVLETVEKRDIMEKLSLMMNQFDQNFQALNTRLEQMELQTVRTIESLSSKTRTQWKEEVLEETSKEAEDDTDKEDDLQEIIEETFANKYDTDRNDEDELAWDLDEAIKNGPGKEKDDENASDSENIIQTSLGPIVKSQYLSEDKFDDDSDPKKNV